MHRDVGANHPAAEGRADRLMPQTDAKNRDAGAQLLDDRDRNARIFGPPGPGEITIRSGRAAFTSSTDADVVAHHAHARRRARPGTGRGCR